ncbi:IS5 family transposase [Deinococcus peraridilitoris]|uniref:Transposase n=1 Tax=Deinococcus peraridilitoris (strain DSM 19664 / LMG 22246 / CIP 109416 / KR-200) TaxID=937777 RepID=L0A7C0_DEIPD|nr:transposase [Deinococcus peraridilitoris DSM 19664]
MVEHLVPDDLWVIVKTVIPAQTPRPHGGRTKIHARRTLAGILYILRWGLPWRQLPLALGFGSGQTRERRFREWLRQGVWARLLRLVLDYAARQGALDWSRASIDWASLPAPRGGVATGPNPTDRGKAGCKLHLLVDRQGLPLAVTISGANVHDSRQLEATLAAVQGVRNGKGGRPQRRPVKLHADKGYDYSRCRTALYQRGIVPRIARRGIESSNHLGRTAGEWNVLWCGCYRTGSWLWRGVCVSACGVTSSGPSNAKNTDAVQ